MGNRPSAEIEIEAARPKSRGHPTSNKRETRFAIVFILQDSDGVAFGAGFFRFWMVMMAIISDVWEMRFAGKGLGCPGDAVRPWDVAFAI